MQGHLQKKEGIAMRFLLRNAAYAAYAVYVIPGIGHGDEYADFLIADPVSRLPQSQSYHGLL